MLIATQLFFKGYYQNMYTSYQLDMGGVLVVVSLWRDRDWRDVTSIYLPLILPLALKTMQHV